MSELRYRTGVGAPDVHPDRFGLEVGECAIYPHGTSADSSWVLAFRFLRTTDGKPETRQIPVVRGVQVSGAWGLERAGAGRWQVSPSIRCLERLDLVGGPRRDVEVWHETPAIVGVPDGEPWQAGVP